MSVRFPDQSNQYTLNQVKDAALHAATNNMKKNIKELSGGERSLLIEVMKGKTPEISQDQLNTLYEKLTKTDDSERNKSIKSRITNTFRKLVGAKNEVYNSVKNEALSLLGGKNKGYIPLDEKNERASASNGKKEGYVSAKNFQKQMTGFAQVKQEMEKASQLRADYQKNLQETQMKKEAALSAALAQQIQVNNYQEGTALNAILDALEQELQVKFVDDPDSDFQDIQYYYSGSENGEVVEGNANVDIRKDEGSVRKCLDDKFPGLKYELTISEGQTHLFLGTEHLREVFPFLQR